MARNPRTFLQLTAKEGRVVHFITLGGSQTELQTTHVLQILAVISIGVVINNYPSFPNIPTIATVYGTQVGFCMVCLIVVLSLMFETPLHKMIVSDTRPGR